MTESKLLIHSSTEVTTFTSGRAFPTKFLQQALPDVETVLFFAKVYGLAPSDVSLVLHKCVPSETVDALTAQAGDHSMSLQDYLVEEFYDGSDWVYPDLEFLEALPGTKADVNAEVLPEVWKNLELTIAESIAKVAETIAGTIEHMPGRTGEMVFQTLAKVNARRPTLGSYEAGFHHKSIKRVLVVFDVSGSMTEPTVRTIVRRGGPGLRGERLAGHRVQQRHVLPARCVQHRPGAGGRGVHGHALRAAGSAVRRGLGCGHLDR